MPAEEAPEAKRARVDFVLQDEQEFLEQHPGSSKVRPASHIMLICAH